MTNPASSPVDIEEALLELLLQAACVLNCARNEHIIKYTQCICIHNCITSPNTL